jgi:tetratricopeptide (TPR) repeat protein
LGRRLTRKEIKRKDPVTEALENFWQYFVENRRFLLMTVTGVLVVIVLVVVGQRIYESSVTASSQAVEKAGELYWKITMGEDEAAPADEAAAPDVTPEKAAESKKKKELNELQELSDEFSPSGFSGAVVNYYRGITLRDSGNPEEAIATLQKTLAADPEPELAMVVRLALAETYRKQGNYDDALKLYDEVAAFEPTNFPKDMVALQKSVCMEEAGRMKEAYDVMLDLQKSYEDKRKDNPQFASPLETQVRTRIGLLKARLKAQGVEIS